MKKNRHHSTVSHNHPFSGESMNAAQCPMMEYLIILSEATEIYCDFPCFHTFERFHPEIVVYWEKNTRSFVLRFVRCQAPQTPTTLFVPCLNSTSKLIMHLCWKFLGELEGHDIIATRHSCYFFWYGEPVLYICIQYTPMIV